jgi:hypothetical protein
MRKREELLLGLVIVLAAKKEGLRFFGPGTLS